MEDREKMNKNRDIKGFTLNELVMVLVILGVMSAILYPHITSFYEDADAGLVRSVTSDVEMAISDGLSRNMTIANLSTVGGLTTVANIVRAGTPPNIAISVPAASQIQVDVMKNGTAIRSATLQIATTGKVNITAINNFNHYVIDSGDMKKN
jgi:prepilin-type N-terminal cleavage/methylation domain-containing protein